MTAKIATGRARTLRRSQPAAEEGLWSALRGYRVGGLKFRRQHPIGGYVVDFACVDRRLVIEVDGQSHKREEQAAFDERRTLDLGRDGWTVLRFTNEQVLAELPLVLAAIERAA